MTVTSKKALRIKLIYSCLLPVFTQLALNFIDSRYALIAFVTLGVLFSVPFTVNNYFIKQSVLEEKEVVLKKIVLTDLLYVTLPSIVSAVLSEVVYSFFFDASGNGLTSVILCVMFILISAMNWFMYPIRVKTAKLVSKLEKPSKKQ